MKQNIPLPEEFMNHIKYIIKAGMTTLHYSDAKLLYLKIFELYCEFCGLERKHFDISVNYSIGNGHPSTDPSNITNIYNLSLFTLKNDRLNAVTNHSTLLALSMCACMCAGRYIM
jgi:hypothetical protein